MKFRVEYVNKLKFTITFFLLLGLSLFAYLCADFFIPIEDKFIDIRSNLSLDDGLYSQRYKKFDENIVIVSINDLTQYEAARSSELNLTRWPWSRVVWARLINFIERQKPTVLVVDLNFSNYEDLSRNYASADMVLADAIGYYDNIVLATALRYPYLSVKNEDIINTLDNFENPYNPTAYPLNMYIESNEMERNISYYSHAPIPNIFTNSATMGVTNLVTYNTDKVRYSQPVYKLVKGGKDYYIPSIALATLMKKEGLEHQTTDIPIKDGVLKIGKHTIRLNEQGQALINWHSKKAVYPDIPVNSLLLSMVRGVDYFEFENKKVPLTYFKDKIVILTQTQISTESHDTPVAKGFADAQVKATIIDNYINDSDTTNTHRKQFLKHIDSKKGVVLTCGFCFAIIFMMLIATNVPLAFINGFLTVIIYIIFAIFVFCHPKYRLLVDMALPLYWMISIFIISFVLKFHHEYKKRKKIQRIFGNLVSEKVLKQLVDKPHRLNLKSTVQKVCVMSCEIHNNLQISAKLPPEKYVNVINSIFSNIEEIIFKYNGTINRFVGNSVLVYWGYPIQSRKDSQNAVAAAIEIQQKIDEYNACLKDINFLDYDERDFENKNPKKYLVDVKIAINTGDALIGQIGPSGTSDFTLLGKAVDVVERVETVCEEFNKSIVITESTLNDLDDDRNLIFIGQVRLKNSTDKIKIFELKLP